MVVFDYAAIFECSHFTAAAAPSFPYPRTVTINYAAFSFALFYTTSAPSFHFFRPDVSLQYYVPNYVVVLVSVQALHYSRPDVALKILCAKYCGQIGIGSGGAEEGGLQPQHDLLPVDHQARSGGVSF